MQPTLPDYLMNGAYFSQDGEAAWSKDDALKVLSWAATSELPILGVEVWIPTNPGPTIPTPFIYTFAPMRVSGETKEQFDVRANKAVMEYIRSFEWDQLDVAHQEFQPYFNLTFDVD